jgi:hypothetical protein
MKKLVVLKKGSEGKNKICVAGGSMSGCTPVVNI